MGVLNLVDPSTIPKHVKDECGCAADVDCLVTVQGPTLLLAHLPTGDAQVLVWLRLSDLSCERLDDGCGALLFLKLVGFSFGVFLVFFGSLLDVVLFSSVGVF